MQQPRAHTQVRPYAVKENGDSVNVVSIALTAHLPMSFRPGAPVVGTRGEISFGDTARFPVREISRLFAARIRLTPTARNDIYR